MHNISLFFNYCKWNHTENMSDCCICRTSNTSVRPCKKISRTPLMLMEMEENRASARGWGREGLGVGGQGRILYTRLYQILAVWREQLTQSYHILASKCPKKGNATARSMDRWNNRLIESRARN